MSDYQGNIIIKNPATPTGPAATGRAPGMWKLSDVAYWVKQGVWPNPAINPDQYFPYVSLLLSTTSLGNANNNLFVDSSGAFNPISRNGNTTQGSFTPYSTNWSNFFDGSGDYFTVPYTTANFDWYTAGVDFTIEYWFFANTLTGTSYFDAGTTMSTVVGNRSATNSTNYWSFGPIASGTVTFYYYNGGPVAVNSTSTITANSWNHIAMTKTSSGITIFVNGVAQTTTAIVGTPQSSASFPITVGQGNNTSYNGYVSNLRIVRGTAIYSGNFTPPTAPLTAVTNTTLLTCQSNRFRDASTNNLTLTVTGDTRVTDFGPFSSSTYAPIAYNQNDITNWSGYFGPSNFIRAGSSANLTLGSGSFTCECWVYPTAFTTLYAALWDFRNSGGFQAAAPLIWIGTDGKVNYQNGAIASSSSLTLNAWTHVAVVRNGTTVTMYFNGVSVGSTTDSTTMTNTFCAVGGVNDVPASYYLSGYISNSRVVIGSAVYTTAFTPPTSPLTAISGTALLTCQNAAFTDNSTNNFILTQNGNPTVTGNSPFNTVGYWSVLFNGSNNWLAASANTATTLGTGNFTIEGWFFTSYSAANQVIIEQAVIDEGTGNNSGWLLYLSTSGNVVFGGAGGQTYINAAPATSYRGKWTHFALVRTSTTSIVLYIDGVSIGSTSTNVNMSAALDVRADTPTLMGSHELQLAGSFFNGYLSNIRIVKGTAVYTSNFTPPTSPLTAISGTGLLTLQSSRLVDNSGNNITVASTFSSYSGGSPSVQSFDPFYTSTIASNGGSMYFDGSGDFLNTATNFPPIGTGDFTAECWWYPVGTASQEFTYFSVGNVTTTSGFALATDPARGLFLYSGGYVNTSGVAMPVANAWNHIVFTRQSGSLRLYLNGSLRETVSWTNSISAAQVYIGRAANGYFGTPLGYMSNIRYSGTSLYSGSTYTVPTAPLTPSANTGLLVNGMNAGIYDATTINDMETVGNAQVRFPTPFAPADYWAAYLNGSSYLTVANNTALDVWDNGSGSFTVEAWIYATSSIGNNVSIVAKAPNNGSPSWSPGWAFQVFNGYLNVNTPGDSRLFNSNTTSVPLNQWVHCALVKSGSTVSIYQNGVRVGTITNSTAYSNTTDAVAIGVDRNFAGSKLTGFVSNVRMVKGTAVYDPTQATLTVPTSPLTAITNTSLLTCQNKTFIDNSANAFTITTTGSPTAGAIGPFTATGGTSVYFDGSGDNLFMPSSPSMNCGTGNWTVEGWVCTVTRTTNYPLIFGNNRGSFTTDALAITASNADSASYNDKFVFAWGSSGFSSPSAGNSFLLVSNVTNSNGVWYHLAIVRNGTSIKMYRNGTEVASATVSSGATFNWGFNGSLAGGGNWDGAQGNWNGYLDDLRVTNGVARYTANFTPPTQAFPTY